MSSRESDDRIQAIANQISAWAAQGNYEVAGGLDVDRALADVFRNPDKFIDSTLSASANWEIIKDEIGIRTQGSIDELLADADSMAREHLRDEIRSQIDEYGLETVVDALNERPGAPAALRERVEDVLGEFPPDVYDAIVRERTSEVLEAVDGFEVVSREEFEQLREAARQPGRASEARQEVLEQLSRSFGQQFSDVDEAVRALQERIASARGERLRIAPIEARRSGEDVLVRISDGDEFTEYVSVARRRARRGIAFPPEQPRGWTAVGEVRIRGDDLELVSIERGVERYGAAEDVDVPLREEFETEQTGLPVEPDRPGDELADEAIRLLRGR